MGRAVTSDAELLDASRRGDSAAFGRIIERYQGAVRAMSFCGIGDRSLAEDVAQETFVTAWGRLTALRDPECLPAWLCGIARNLARSARRSRGRELSLEERDPGGDATPFDAISDRETEEIVAQALARVPDKYREPLVLVYGGECSVRDAARVLGISEQATHQRLSRGRRHLAGDVSGLVESSLARRRSRRDLAAGVLAAISLAIGSSRAEATSMTTPGAHMWKIGLGAATLAALALTGHVAQRSNAEPARPPAGAQARHEASAAGVAHQVGDPAAGASLAWGAFPSGRPTRRAEPAPALPPHATEPDVVLDCHNAARRFGELVAETVPDAATMTTSARDQIIRSVAAHQETACAAEHWTPHHIACVITADSEVIAGTVCGFEDPAVSRSLPGNAVVLAASVPPAELEDLSCRAAAVHIAELTRPDPKSLANLPTDRRAAMLEAIEKGRQTVPDMIEAACAQGAWSDQVRRCVLLATNMTEFTRCLVGRR